MTLSTDQLIAAALAMPDPDRLEIADALLASIKSQSPHPFAVEWQKEIRRRSEDLRTGKQQPIPWSDVKRQAWE